MAYHSHVIEGVLSYLPAKKDLVITCIQHFTYLSMRSVDVIQTIAA